MPKNVPDLKDVSDINIATAKQFALQIVGDAEEGSLKRELEMLFDKIERSDESSDDSGVNKKILLLLSKAKDGKPEQLAAAVGAVISMLKRGEGEEDEASEVDRMIKQMEEEFAVADNSEELKGIQKSLEELPDKIAASVAAAMKLSRDQEDEEDKDEEEEDEEDKDEDEDEAKVKRDKAKAKIKRDKAKKKKKKDEEDDEDEDEEDDSKVVRALKDLSSRLEGLPIRRGLEGPNDGDLEITDEDTGKTARRKVVERLKRSEDYKNDDPAGRLSRLVDLKVEIEGDGFADDEEEDESDE